MKLCRKCNTEKSFDDFYKNKFTKNGKSSYCKPCSIKQSSEFYKKNPEHCKALQQKWRSKNPERVQFLQDRWQNENYRPLKSKKWKDCKYEYKKPIQLLLKRNIPSVTLLSAKSFNQAQKLHAALQHKIMLDKARKELIITNLFSSHAPIITKPPKQKIKSQKRNVKYISNYLRSQSCVDCGNNNPVVLEFDHVRGIKEFGLSRAREKGYSIKRIQEEIDKCEIRCANCHRIRHHNERKK